MRYLMLGLLCLVACGDDEMSEDAAIDRSVDISDESQDAMTDATARTADALLQEEQRYVTLYCECSDTPDCENLTIINQLAEYSVAQLECIKRGAESAHTIEELECFIANMNAITDCMGARTCAEDRFACITEEGLVCSGDSQKLFAVTEEVKSAANMGCSEQIP